MNEKKEKGPPRCPLNNTLPPSRLIWQGTYGHLGEKHPCRVVLAYKHSLPKGADHWECVPEYIFERAPSRDYMREWTYERAPLSEIPATFFEAVIEAFDGASKEC